MNILAYIPARSGSKGIPHKNIKMLGGRPLLAWSIETAKGCNLRVVVDSDSKEYLRIAADFGAETLLRPKHLAKDDTSMFELLKAEVPKLGDIDAVVLLQPTTPFRKHADIHAALKELDKGYDSVILAEKVISPHPDEMLVLTPHGLQMADERPIQNRITRRQDFRPTFIPNGTYVFRTSNLSHGDMYGSRVGFVVCSHTPNINTQEDWDEVERLCAQK